MHVTALVGWMVVTQHLLTMKAAAGMFPFQMSISNINVIETFSPVEYNVFQLYRFKHEVEVFSNIDSLKNGQMVKLNFLKELVNLITLKSFVRAISCISRQL